MNTQTLPGPETALPRRSDPILTELWEIKRQINAEAGYRIDVLARMAREATQRLANKLPLTSHGGDD